MWPSLIDVFNNGQRLAQAQAIVLKQRQAALWVQTLVSGQKLLAFAQVDNDLPVVHTFELERRAHPKGCQGTPVAVK